MKEPTADYRGFTFFYNFISISWYTNQLMKAIYYINYFTDGLTNEYFNKLIQTEIFKNNENGITGLLIIIHKHFFEILEGEDEDHL